VNVDENDIQVILHQEIVTLAVIGLSSHQTLDSEYATVPVKIPLLYGQLAA